MDKAVRNFVGRRKRALIIVMALWLPAMTVLALSDDKGFLGRYTLGVALTEYNCLPWRFYFVDYGNRSAQPGDLVVVEAQGLAPHIPDGAPLIKVLAAGPGDQLEVTANGLAINRIPWSQYATALRADLEGHTVVDELPLTQTLGAEPETYFVTATLKHDEFAVLGTTGNAYDSRYFGPVSRARILAHVVPLF